MRSAGRENGMLCALKLSRARIARHTRDKEIYSPEIGSTGAIETGGSDGGSEPSAPTTDHGHIEGLAGIGHFILVARRAASASGVSRFFFVRSGVSRITP